MIHRIDMIVEGASDEDLQDLADLIRTTTRTWRPRGVTVLASVKRAESPRATA